MHEEWVCSEATLEALLAALGQLLENVYLQVINRLRVPLDVLRHDSLGETALSTLVNLAPQEL